MKFKRGDLVDTDSRLAFDPGIVLEASGTHGGRTAETKVYFIREAQAWLYPTSGLTLVRNSKAFTKAEMTPALASGLPDGPAHAQAPAMPVASSYGPQTNDPPSPLDIMTRGKAYVPILPGKDVKRL